VTVLIDTTTRVLVQGITEDAAAALTEQMLAYGTPVVAGVAPGRYGDRVAGVPVYNTVADAVLFHQPSATLIAVPPDAVLDAALEALSHDIRLLLIATEFVPEGDVQRLLGWARDSAARVLGPGSAGIIAPAARLRIGMIGGENPDRNFSPGRVGVIAPGATLAADIAALTRRLGIGHQHRREHGHGSDGGDDPGVPAPPLRARRRDRRRRARGKRRLGGGGRRRHHGSAVHQATHRGVYRRRP
jgi:succinyl-CoA synthetase alpha subunit